MTFRSNIFFTMIELMAVITIIFILTSLLLPALSGARSHGKNIACKSNLKQFAFVEVNYVSDSDGYIVPCRSTGSDSYGYAYWFDLYGNYVKYDEQFRGYSNPSTIWFCPANSGGYIYGSAPPYRVFNYLHNLYSGCFYSSSNWSVTPAIKISSVNKPSITVLLTDGANTGQVNIQNTTALAAFGIWHNRYGNVLHCDGHVSSLPYGGVTYSTSPYNLRMVIP